MCILHAVNTFNGLVHVYPGHYSHWPYCGLTPTSKVLSYKTDTQRFRALLDYSSPANKARLLTASALHASSWLSVVPSAELGLHLDPHEFCVGIRWCGSGYLQRSSLSSLSQQRITVEIVILVAKVFWVIFNVYLTF